jgi:hypothetical protein
MVLTTREVLIDLIAEWAPGESAIGAADAVLDLFGIAPDRDEASTLVETVSGMFGLAHEPSSLSDTVVPRIRFLTSPDPSDWVSAHVRMDGQVEVRTRGLGYALGIHPQATNAATLSVRVDR